MKLSVLILTHKRPALFQRCLKSVLKNIPKDVEVIVLNDSNDISEIDHQQVTYFYRAFDNLSKNYKFVLDRACGDYIYYLEDDDYLSENFFNILDKLNSDIIGGNYYPTWNDDWVMRCTTSMSSSFKLDDETFQLSQFIMRRNLVNTFEFPNDSHIHNDRKLVEHVLKQSINSININMILYYQTTDGGDNISFPESRNYYGN